VQPDHARHAPRSHHARCTVAPAGFQRQTRSDDVRCALLRSLDASNIVALATKEYSIMDCSLVGWCALSLAEQAAWVQAIGSIGAIIVAVLVARMSSNETRRLIVAQARPHLHIEMDRLRAEPQFRVRLTNEGLGSAVINSIRILVDGQRMWGIGIEPFRHTLERLCANGFGEPGTIEAPRVGEWISPGKELQMLSISLSEKLRDLVSRDPVGMLRPAAMRLRIIISYSDIFGNQFVVEGPEVEDPIPGNNP
jgi:hypothetical protein